MDLAKVWIGWKLQSYYKLWPRVFRWNHKSSCWAIRLSHLILAWFSLHSKLATNASTYICLLYMLQYVAPLEINQCRWRCIYRKKVFRFVYVCMYEYMNITFSMNIHKLIFGIFFVSFEINLKAKPWLFGFSH